MKELFQIVPDRGHTRPCMVRGGMKHGPKHAWYDDRAAPIIVMTIPPEIEDASLASALDAVVAWTLKEVNAPFGFIVDVRRPIAITPKQRKMAAEAERSYAHVDARFNAAQAFVVANALSRGIVTALTWLSPPVYPYTVVGSLDEAFQWVEPRFDRFFAAYPHGRPQ